VARVVRTVAPPADELEAIRRKYGRFHERRFTFTPPGAQTQPFPPRGREHIRAWAIVVPVDIYRQSILVRKVGEKDWFFPGGGVEPGESIEQAATRELEEEVGLESEGGGLKALWWWTVNWANGPATLAHFVFLQTAIGSAEVRDAKEIAEVRTLHGRPTPDLGAYHTLIHDALADTGMIHQWEIDYEVEQKFGTG